MISSVRRAKREKVTQAKAPSGGVLLDTGVIIALYARNDPQHLAATRWLAGFRGVFHTVEPVLTETAYFLPTRLRAAISELVDQGVIQVHHPDCIAYGRIAELLRKYADIDPDWADVSLV